MKRIPTYPVILALLLTVVFTDCRHEPLPETGKAIRFSVGPAVSVDMQTKADNLSTEEDFKASRIALYGVNEAGTLFDGSSDTSELKYDSNDEKWKYSPLKYWDKNKTYDFRAVSPIGAVVPNGTAAKTGSVTARYGNYDLMVASNHAPTVMNTVSLAFIHAGAAVRFLFKKGADETQTVTISHFEVKNVYSAGTVTCAWDGTKDVLTPAPDSRQSVFTWDETPGDVRELTSDYKSFDGWHYVVPQALGSDTTVEFTYDVDSGTETTSYNATLFFPTSSEWKPGKTYEYQINIENLTVGMAFTVNPWPDAVNGSYTIR